MAIQVSPETFAQAKSGPDLKNDALLVKTLSGSSFIKRPSGCSIIAILSINQVFQFFSSPRYFVSSLRNLADDIGSILAVPLNPRCNITPFSFSKWTNSIAHFGLFSIRLTELESVEPSSQMASSSQTNQTGALHGAPSFETVARFATIGRTSNSCGSKGVLGIMEVNIGQDCKSTERHQHNKIGFRAICRIVPKTTPFCLP